MKRGETVPEVDPVQEHILGTAMRSAAKKFRLATQEQESAVLRARVAGVSWTKIGEHAGMTRQSARKKWGWIQDEIDKNRVSVPAAPAIPLGARARTNPARRGQLAELERRGHAHR